MKIKKNTRLTVDVRGASVKEKEQVCEIMSIITGDKVMPIGIDNEVEHLVMNHLPGVFGHRLPSFDDPHGTTEEDIASAIPYEKFLVGEFIYKIGS